MTLLDAPAESNSKSRAMAFTIAVVSVVAAVVLWFAFRYYPEKRAAERLFDALAAGKTSEAYRLWKPGPSYTERDFTADWGPSGYYGPVKSYKIMRVEAPERIALRSSEVVVTVAVSPFSPMPDKENLEKSRRTKVISVWVKADDKSFSFPP